MALAKHYDTHISIYQFIEVTRDSYSDVPRRVCNSLNNSNMTAVGSSNSIDLWERLSKSRNCEETSEITLAITKGDKAKSSCQCNCSSKTRAS
jgi:hypothetical protein